MKTELSRSEEGVREDIAGYARDAFKEHKAILVNENEWLCRKFGRSEYWFRLIFRPGMILVYGDLGEWVFRMHDENSLNWLRCSIDSPHYMFEKMRACDGDRETFYWMDAKKWLKEYLEDGVEDDDGDLLDFHDMCAGVISNDHYNGEPTHEGFLEEMHDNNIDDIYTIGVGWSSHSYWVYEALKWFVENEGK